ncbi:hypothetical protein GCM10009678_43070 [Actinomadura kijaniata]|uniref:Hint domain-containing protein n=1 Tax=Actinomadura namibiensis TaxID=182080 RepID=A0A7W3LU20_ACTNM|nr:RNase A-like domain-containing protein [Actinomadura namibiensis]MBA8954304.1 hypothetical protein [Actinomadura namibiensis]
MPWGKIGKLPKTIPKVVKVLDRMMDIKRRLEKARQARKNAKKRADDAEEACKLQKEKPNSFVAGTPVLLADGTRKPIERIRVGDRVRATDPESGRSGVRVVTDRIVGEGRKRLVDLTVDLDGELGGPTDRITATLGHRFWVSGSADWIEAGGLVFGDMLTGPDGRTAMVLSGRRHERVVRVHNLTVDDLRSYYVSTGARDVLVHNCHDLDRHEEPSPRPRVPDPLRLGHTLRDHVDATDAELLRKARDPGNTSGVAGRWGDRSTAEQAIDYALVHKTKKVDHPLKIANWLRKGDNGPPTLSLDMQFPGGASLGDVMRADGTKVPAGNRYRVVLKRAPGHRGGYYVYTAFPLP